MYVLFVGQYGEYMFCDTLVTLENDEATLLHVRAGAGLHRRDATAAAASAAAAAAASAAAARVPQDAVDAHDAVLTAENKRDVETLWPAEDVPLVPLVTLDFEPPLDFEANYSSMPPLPVVTVRRCCVHTSLSLSFARTAILTRW